jgi:plastocyanin
MFSMHRFFDLAGNVKRFPGLRRSALVAVALVALSVADAAWLGDGHQAHATEAVITIRNFSFTPPLLTVPAGTTVTWVNEDDEPHTVVEGDKLFKSHALDTGDKFSFTFTTPGTFKYSCTIHAHMVGAVVVTTGQQTQ